jgi:class 3 adenylate cyclase
VTGEPLGRRLLRLIPKPVGQFLEHAPEIHPFTLRFLDPAVEREHERVYFRDVLPYIRIANVLGIASWVLLGILAAIELERDQVADLVIRYGIGIPLIAISLAMTYASWYPRYWKVAVTAVIAVSAVVWSFHRVYVGEARPSWSWAGMMLLLAFAYILTRLPFVYATALGAFAIVCFNVVEVVFANEPDPFHFLLYANFFLVSFAIVGMAASYGLERSARLLYLRELELDRARARADALLENTLPRAVVDRLKDRHEAPQTSHLADGFAEVSVLFADLVRFTEQAETIAPEPLVVILDEVFTRFDALADRFGMEKIKTVGDAYMAVAGAPEARPDHAVAAAEMALGIVEVLRGERWPGGEPMEVRVGVATGPVVAGVIGRRRFAYDLWGDTVNLASRLESSGTPGRILVSEATVAELGDRYRFSDVCVLDLKGKGPTAARFLEGRVGHGDGPPAPGP